MANGSVVVHSVDRLEAFRDLLQQQHDALEEAYDLLNAACTQQGENWNDPQYTHLQSCIDMYYQLSKTQLAQLEDSTAYITTLIEKLREI